MNRFFDERTNTMYLVSNTHANANLTQNDLSDNPLVQLPNPQNAQPHLRRYTDGPH